MSLLREDYMARHQDQASTELIDIEREQSSNYRNKNTTRRGLYMERRGLGKCFAPDTLIMMYNGTMKKVQEIQVGELLMGDEGSQREVMSLASGIENMYEIRQENGISYTVNESHILSLVIDHPIVIEENETQFDLFYFERSEKLYEKDIYTRETFLKKLRAKKSTVDERIAVLKNLKKIHEKIDIRITDYFKISETNRRKLRGYKSLLIQPQDSSEISPMMSRLKTVQSPLAITESRGHISPHPSPHLTTHTHSTTSEPMGLSTRSSLVGVPSPRRDEEVCVVTAYFSRTPDFLTMRELNDVKKSTLNVNFDYYENFKEKYNDPQLIRDILSLNFKKRSLFVAKLIEFSGSTSEKTYTIVLDDKEKVEPISSICRSLGVFVEIETDLLEFTEGAKKTYFQIHIEGDLNRIEGYCSKKLSKSDRIDTVEDTDTVEDEILEKDIFEIPSPTTPPSPQGRTRGLQQDRTKSKISIHPRGLGKYFGFEISGVNRRFLLHDYTVVHNTRCMTKVIDTRIKITKK